VVARRAADTTSVGSRIAFAACVFVLLVLAGCGGSSTPTSVVRSYEHAILSKNGDALCATFSPKLREVVGEQIASEDAGAASSGAPRYDCGSYYHLLIGYPHENTDRQFVSGDLLKVGSPTEVKRAGVAYVKVSAKLRFAFVSTGYTMRSGEKGAATVDDTVWLSKGKDGKWSVVKPSLALVAASSPDALFRAYSVAQANAPPPDPDYSMNRAERTAYEAADYRASFHRKLGHTPLRCDGNNTTANDALHDAVLRPIGTTRFAAAPRGNDIVRATVQKSRLHVCVAVTFRKKPAGHLQIGFTPRSQHAFFPEYVIEIDPSLGVRGGGLSGGYRYFRGGEQLDQSWVDEVSIYGRTVAFGVNPGVARDPSRAFPADLTWNISTTAPTGGDQLSNQPAGK
jgi:hypothetical protein